MATSGNIVFTIDWTINKFLHQVGSAITSKVYSTPNSSDKWQLQMKRTTEYEEVSEHILMLEEMGGYDPGHTHTAFYPTLIPAVGTGQVLAKIAIEAKLGSLEFSSPSSQYYVGNTIKHSSSIDRISNRSDVLAKYGKEDLVVTCTIGYIPTDADSNQDDTTTGSLTSDVEKFFAQTIKSIPTDVSIVLRDGIFKTHRVVLSLRSDVFRAMFERDMLEKNNSKVELPDFNVRTFKQLVKFFVEDEVDDLPKFAVDLFLLADKYNVPKLKIKCENCLAANVSKNNSAQLLSLTQQVSSMVIERKLFELYKP